MIRRPAAALAALMTAMAGLAAGVLPAVPVLATETGVEPASAFELDLGGYRFDPLQSVPASTRAALAATPDLRIVQFIGPTRPEWLSALEHEGVRVLQYIHPYTYVVWAGREALGRAAQRPEIRWSGDFVAEFRVGPADRSLDATPRPTMALLSRHADIDAVRAALRATGARIDFIEPLNTRFSIAQFTVAGDRYLEVASVPGIYAVQDIEPLTEEQMMRGEMSNQSVVGAHGAAPTYTITPGYESWLAGAGYDGTGVIVGIVDGGTLMTHQDLVGQGSPCVAGGGALTSCTAGSSDHGTHVGAAVAGTGASNAQLGGFLRGQGVAPGAKLVSQRYGPFLGGGGPGGMAANAMLTIYRESALGNAVLTNNSWGPTSTPQGYDIPTQQIDIISRDALADMPGSQPVLPVWSIMNGYGDAGGACAPASVGSPDEAKNLFAIGSTSLQNGSGAQLAGIFNVSSNSAHGNACDGRRIPHMVAPGCNTDSAGNGTSSYGLSCGTSMASPVVSGAVALFIEKYRDAHEGVTPSPALVKAAFTAAARNLQGFQNADGGVMGHRPDRFQGYGRLDLDAVINPDTAVYFFDQATVFTASGQDWLQSVVADDPTRPIQVMLAWTDAPGHGLGGTTPAWVNDLNLTVVAGQGVYYGNVIGADGWSATGGNWDDRNNLEGVFLSPEQHGGSVLISVNAANIAADALDPHAPGMPRQDFALACYNCSLGDGFLVQLMPTAASICAPDEATTDVKVTGVGGFDQPVALGASNLPGAATASFSPAIVGPLPANSTLTIGNTASVPTGTYAIAIEGSAGGQTVSAPFHLTVAASAPTAPILLSPAPGSANVALAPTFSWDSVPGAANYRLEVATDASFTNVLIEETVPGTSFTPTGSLDPTTVHYWRVSAGNGCGDSIPSMSPASPPPRRSAGPAALPFPTAMPPASMPTSTSARRHGSRPCASACATPTTGLVTPASSCRK
ncbi:S8 family serine peptidase [Pseudofulvimonas gallinarii]|uniref:S8 family serine peptidase n=1 Tax=Pseudofulvimonas gallinarii TaxID=634155 RepID=UPI000F4893F7|nr:S8 family serine peptidase [Pseudofulvimonas gallinarii]